MVRTDLFSGSLAVLEYPRQTQGFSSSRPESVTGERRQNSVRTIFNIHRQLKFCKLEEAAERSEKDNFKFFFGGKLF
jgi:hypothetical protein